MDTASDKLEAEFSSMPPLPPSKEMVALEKYCYRTDPKQLPKLWLQRIFKDTGLTVNETDAETIDHTARAIYAAYIERTAGYKQEALDRVEELAAADDTPDAHRMCDAFKTALSQTSCRLSWDAFCQVLRQHYKLPPTIKITSSKEMAQLEAYYDTHKPAQLQKKREKAHQNLLNQVIQRNVPPKQVQLPQDLQAITIAVYADYAQGMEQLKCKEAQELRTLKELAAKINTAEAYLMYTRIKDTCATDLQIGADMFHMALNAYYFPATTDASS
jgi:hypothetical protein